MIDGEMAGFIATISGVLINVPQLRKVMQTKQTRDLSLITLLLIMFTNVFWAVNGCCTDSPSRLYGSIVIFALTIPMLYFKIVQLKTDK